MLSTLVIANNVAKTPRQMAKDIRAWDEYTSTPLVRNLVSFNEKGLKCEPGILSLPTAQELADKAKDLGLVDGLPFTYYTSNNGTLIEIDLQSIETQFEVIRQTCEQLAPYHSVFIPHRNKAMKVDMAGKYGFIRITQTLCKKLQLIYDFVNTIDNQLAENSEEIISAIASTQTGKEKLQLIHIISGLIWTFRREYFNDIPVFLSSIAIDDPTSLYLFNYEQINDEPELPQEMKTKIQTLAGDREKLQSLRGFDDEEYQEDPQATEAELQQEIDDLRAKISQRNSINADEYAAIIKQYQADEQISKVQSENTRAEIVELFNRAEKITSKRQPFDSTDTPLESAIESIDTFTAQIERDYNVKVEECSIKFDGGFVTKTF
jgi:hypothetical protein